MNSFEGKVAVVTGGAYGMGKPLLILLRYGITNWSLHGLTEKMTSVLRGEK